MITAQFTEIYTIPPDTRFGTIIPGAEGETDDLSTFITQLPTGKIMAAEFPTRDVLRIYTKARYAASKHNQTTAWERVEVVRRTNTIIIQKKKVEETDA